MQGFEFLVRVDNNYFLESDDGRQLLVTDTPSHALHVTYQEADTWCQRLRRRGYPQAIITDIAGVVMTHDRLKEYRQSQSQLGTPEVPLPKSREELDRMPPGEYRRHYATDPAFRQRADELEAKPREPRKTKR